MSGAKLELGVGFRKFHPELSAQVKQLQVLLKKWGYNIGETGHFDWETDAALIHFQKSVGQSGDGKMSIGSGKTWLELNKIVPPTPNGRGFSVDTLDSVPFINQFDHVHVGGAGNEACFKASIIMLRAVGIKQAGNEVKNKFQIVTNETWSNHKPKQTIDSTALSGGLAYLDAQLARGRPVMAGVSYSDQPAGHKSNEGITEHYVVIVAKHDSMTYLFHDPATTSRNMGANRQFVRDPNTDIPTAEGIPGHEGYAVGARYFVTVIRKNEE